MNSSPAYSRKSGPARRAQGGWTTEDDEVLKKAVKIFEGKQWKKIASYVKKFSESQCLHRWTKVVNPEVNKSPFTPQEDEILINLVQKHGIGKWSFIARHLDGRIGKQCRERWLNQLSPSIKKGPWTEEEELILIKAHSVHGNKWTKIAELLPGRTDNAIKNHWNCNLKKKQHDQGVTDEHIADSRPSNKSGFSGGGSNTNTKNISSLSVNDTQELNISELSTSKKPLHLDLNQDPNSEHLETVVNNSGKQPEASSMAPNSKPHSSNETSVETNTPQDFVPAFNLASPISLDSSNFLKSTSGSIYHNNTQSSSSKVKSHSDTDLMTRRRKKRRSDNVSCKENIVSISKSNVHEVSNKERVVLGNIEDKPNTSSVKDCTKISEYIATGGRQLDFTSVECEQIDVGSPSSFERTGTANFS